MRVRLTKLWDEWTDKDHGWLNARLMSMLGMLVSSVVVIVFTWRGTLGLDIFLAYLAYAGGTASYFKRVDNQTARRELELGAEVTKERINADSLR